MDQLTFFVASHHLKVRLQRLALHPDLWKFGQGTLMTPTFKGLGSSLAGLKHTLDTLAAPMAADIEEIANTAPDLLKQARAELAATRQAIGDIKDFVEGLKTNGAPPLPDSKALSDNSGVEVKGAGTTAVPPAETLLTTNGVQVAS